MIRVLIADDSLQVSDNISRRLGLESDLLVCGTARDGETAVQDALRLRPDIAVVDAGLPGMDGGQTTEMLAQCLPGTGVIMMSMEAENDAYRLAMLAGAREFLQKPFKGDDLVAAVRRVHAFEQRRVVAAPAPPARPAAPAVPSAPRGIVTVVLSGKGGVGKTVVAVNLAATLGAHANRVALLDFSMQFGDVAAALNLPTERTVTDLLMDEHTADGGLIQQAMVEGPAGVSVLLAPTSPEVADFVTAKHLRELIGVLRGSYDHIVIDTAAYLTEASLGILDLAQHVVLVTDLSVTGVKNARLTRGVLDTLRIDPELVYIVANHRESAGELDRTGAESFLGARIASEIPHDAAVVASSVNEGVPFVVSSPATAVSAAVRAVAGAMDPALQIGSEAPRPAGASDKKRGARRLLSFSR
jgi:pilus assembly protein CpaE